MNTRLCDKVMIFEIGKLTPFCIERSSVRKMILKSFSSLFSALWLKSGKICKNDDHTCLILELTLAEYCGLVFKELSWDPAKIKKKVCDPYI